MIETSTRVYKRADLAAKADAASAGIVGAKGGWLYNVQGRAVCHGYGALAERLIGRGRIKSDDGGMTWYIVAPR